MGPGFALFGFYFAHDLPDVGNQKLEPNSRLYRWFRV